MLSYFILMCFTFFQENMTNIRKYGNPPFSIAVIHGGPGAPGEMAPVARELSSQWGVLEPLQTQASIDGQIEELKTVLEQNANLPVTLIGWSWGSFLSYIFASKYPLYVKKLILVSSGPFDATYAANIMQTRLDRLNEKEKLELQELIKSLNEQPTPEKNKLGKLIFFKADSFDPITDNTELIEFQYHIYQSVWKEAEKLRQSGKLLEFGKTIECPVVAIHGDYDPHPYQGVKKPLGKILKNFKFILLKNCGHHPWLERKAKKQFYEALKQELE